MTPAASHLLWLLGFNDRRGSNVRGYNLDGNQLRSFHALARAGLAVIDAEGCYRLTAEGWEALDTPPGV